MAKKGSSSGGPSRRSARATPFVREFPGSSESANANSIALLRTYDALISATNKVTAPFGLSAAGRQALAILEGAPGPLTPTVIAQRLFVTTASTTSLLDTLERRELIVRTPDPDDRRKTLVSLTDEGRRLVDEFLPQVVALQTAAFADLSEEDRTQMLRSLAIIQETVAQLDAPAIAAAALPRSKPKSK